MAQLSDIITDLKSSGVLQALLSAGLISPKIVMYHDLHTKYDFYSKRGMKTNEAVRQTAITTNVCERTIFRAIRVMRTPTDTNRSTKS